LFEFIELINRKHKEVFSPAELEYLFDIVSKFQNGKSNWEKVFENFLKNSETIHQVIRERETKEKQQRRSRSPFRNRRSSIDRFE
jgi:hypothetical protein